MALTKISYSDNEKLELGTGNDLEIYHDANHSYIAEVGTGSLKIKGDDVRLENASGNNVFKLNSSVAELSHNGSTKLVTSATGVDVTGQLVTDGASHAGDVTFQGDGANAYWDKSADDLIFNDNAKAAFGTGSDFTIHHNGSNSKIDNTTGTLYIQGDVISLAGAGGSENLAVFTKNGSCEFYYDNAKKLETQSGGVRVYGDLENHNDDFVAKDNCKFTAGNSADLEIYHDGSNSFIKEAGTGSLYIASDSWFYITNAAGSETILKAGADSQVELYYDNSKKFETTSGGASVTGNLGIDTTTPAAALDFGVTSVNENVIHLRKNSNSIIGFGVNSGYGIKAFAPHDITSTNAIFETGTIGSDGSTYTQEGIQVLNNGNLIVNSGDVTLADSKKLKLGASADLEIYHDGSHSYVHDSGTGNLKIKSSRVDILNPAGDEDMIVAVENGQVELHYDNSKKLVTTSAGVEIVNSLIVDGTDRSAAHANNQDFVVGNTSQAATGMALVTQSGGYCSIVMSDGQGDKNKGLIAYNHADDSFKFVNDPASGSDGLILQSSNDVKIASGDLIFGTAGKGVVLGATSNTDANTLDDYEEGSWTPNDASGQSLTVTASNSTYTKIGDTVIARCKLTMPNTTNSSTLKVGGLPFTVGTLDGGCGQGVHNDSQTYGWLAIAGTTYLQAYAAASLSASTWNQVSTSEVYGLNIIYKVA